MAIPTEFNRSPLNSSQQIVNEAYDLVADQISIFKERLSSSNSTSKELHSLCHGTVMLCASFRRDSEVIDLLETAEVNMVFAGAPESKAKLYSAAICKLIGNDSHAKAFELHSSAIGRGVWNNQSDYENQVKEKLNEAGFKL